MKMTIQSWFRNYIWDKAHKNRYAIWNAKCPGCGRKMVGSDIGELYEECDDHVTGCQRVQRLFDEEVLGNRPIREKVKRQPPPDYVASWLSVIKKLLTRVSIYLTERLS